MPRFTLLLAPMLFLGACADGSLAGPGEACETEADCEEGLECHLHDGEMECEEPHDDDDTDDEHTDEA